MTSDFVMCHSVLDSVQICRNLSQLGTIKQEITSDKNFHQEWTHDLGYKTVLTAESSESCYILELSPCYQGWLNAQRCKFLKRDRNEV